MPQRSRSHINVDNVKIFTTPRKLISSLQDPNSDNSEVSEKQSRRFRSPCASKFDSSPASKYDDNGLSHHPASMYDQYGFLRNVNQNHDTKSKENMALNGEDHGSSESVSSSEYVHAVADVQQVSQKLVPGTKTESLTINAQKDYPMSVRSMVCGLFTVLFSAFVCLLWIGSDQDEGYNLLPT